MKVLVIGGGGREHAMARALATGDAEVFLSPGNPGTQTLARNLPAATTHDDVIRQCHEHGIALVVVGPEAPLVGGLADALAEAAIPCCGPSQAASQLEGSKLFTRELGHEVGLPQPAFVSVGTVQELDAALEQLQGLPVVKADGLAAGKGVSLPDDRAGVRRETEALLGGSMGEAGSRVVLEERLEGTEASLFFACSGAQFVELPNARDHKRLFDGQRGPNTGGMGAVSPNPELDEQTRKRVRDEIVRPTLLALDGRGMPFVGFLYVGVMLTTDGPKLVEFNVRLGDPEAQCILPRLRAGDFLELCTRVGNRRLEGYSLDWDERSVAAVVLAADGYPKSPRKGDVIEIDSVLETSDRWLDHAGTRERNGQLLTEGGRVAAVVARGNTGEEARQRAYEGVEKVRFNGMHYRTDIGN